MGHDIVPHFHEHDHDLSEHSATFPISSNNSLANLQNLFSHFQHGVNEVHLVYLTTAEKHSDFQRKSSVPTVFFAITENPLVFYINYKKQRFKDYLSNPPDLKLNAFSLRGPPTC